MGNVGYSTIPKLHCYTRIPPRQKVEYDEWTVRLQKRNTFRPMFSELTSQEALRLTAAFAFTADRMRTADETFTLRTRICETASRVAFLQAHRIAQREEILPRLGETFRRAIFATA